MEKLISTLEDNDLLAIQHSLLQDNYLLEEKWGAFVYWLGWPLMMFVSLWLAIKVNIYRLIKRSWRQGDRKQKERWLLGPERGTIFFDGRHPWGYRVRNGVMGWTALDVIYSTPAALAKPQSLRDRLLRFWLNQPDGQAVRNRLRLTFETIKLEMERLARLNYPRPIRILVLAAGSAQATLEALGVVEKTHPQARFEVIMVDLNQTALEQARSLAMARQIRSVIRYELLTLGAKLRSEADERWDIIEMVGWLDYQIDNKVVETCQEIRRILKPDGLFITAMIAPSFWSSPVRWVINWPKLRRRSAKVFAGLLRQAFKDGEICLRPEWWRIHTLAYCRRTAARSRGPGS